MVKKKKRKKWGGGFSGSSACKESAHNAGDPGWIPGLGRSPGEGNAYPFPYSGLENSMDYILHGVAESDTMERPSLMVKRQENTTGFHTI